MEALHNFGMALATMHFLVELDGEDFELILGSSCDEHCFWRGNSLRLIDFNRCCPVAPDDRDAVNKLARILLQSDLNE